MKIMTLSNNEYRLYKNMEWLLVTSMFQSDGAMSQGLEKNNPFSQV